MVSHILILGVLAFQLAGSAQTTVSAAAVPATPPVTQVREISPQERGDIYMARKMYREAIDVYKSITPPTAFTANKIGIAYHQLSDMETAERYYQRAAKLDKTFAEPLNNLGTIYYKRESYRRAINQYKKSLRLKPSSAATLANLGTAYFARKQNKLASDCYREALRLDPRVFENGSGGGGSIMREKSIGDRAGFFYIMAKSYAQEGLVEQALNYIRKAIEEGFKDRNKFTEESEFSKLQENPEFKLIMALEPKSL